MTSDMRVHAWGGARGQNLEHLRIFVSFAFYTCIKLFVFEQQLLFGVDSLSVT